jgi:thiol-disulfide isomerase/thioredoxin
MYRIFSFLIVCCFMVAQTATAQEGGIDFFHGTWAEALQKAKDQKRLIFVDAYAEWCGPCKRMAATVFPEKQAGDFFNKNFINLKIDMEKPENEAFAIKFPVGSYPTLMVIDEAGKLVVKDIGAKSVEALIEFGKKALSANNKSADFAKRYDAGERAPQFIHDYIVELNKARKPSLKIVNEYLRTAKPEDDTTTQKIIFEGAIEADSKVFDKMVEQIKTYRKTYGDERVDARILQACDATVEKAIAYKEITLLQEAKEKFGRLTNKSAAAEFATRSDKAYFSATKDAKAYVMLLEPETKAHLAEKRYAAVEKQVIDAVKAFNGDAAVLTWAETSMKSLLKAENEPKFYFTLIEVQQKMNNLKEALKTAKKGKELAEKGEDRGLVSKFDFYIQALEERI